MLICLQHPGYSRLPVLATDEVQTIAASPRVQAASLDALPAANSHPLPPTLARWVDRGDRGDYFDQVQKTAPEYLIWSEFPVKVYIEPVLATDTANLARAKAWVEAVSQAVQEWNLYLPLQVVNQADAADIRVSRSFLPLRVSPDAAPSRTRSPISLPRIRSAETRYELYVKPLPNASQLAHRCTVVVQPNQAANYVLASARHELGHALGIWGHSLLQTDALYFSQVRNPPSISTRDINTLKRVYQQPTRLGWTL